jgi:hypothetical protein
VGVARQVSARVIQVVKILVNPVMLILEAVEVVAVAVALTRVDWEERVVRV